MHSLFLVFSALLLQTSLFPLRSVAHFIYFPFPLSSFLTRSEQLRALADSMRPGKGGSNSNAPAPPPVKKGTWGGRRIAGLSLKVRDTLPTEEDLSDKAFEARHDKYEQEEKSVRGDDKVRSDRARLNAVRCAMLTTEFSVLSCPDFVLAFAEGGPVGDLRRTRLPQVAHPRDLLAAQALLLRPPHQAPRKGAASLPLPAPIRLSLSLLLRLILSFLSPASPSLLIPGLLASGRLDRAVSGRGRGQGQGAATAWHLNRRGPGALSEEVGRVARPRFLLRRQHSGHQGASVMAFAAARSQ